MGTFTSESVPTETMKELLETNWESFYETHTPTFLIINDTEGDFLKINYNIGDYVLISSEGSESIKYRGNIQYYDKTHPLVLQIGTKEGPQRLRDIWKMTRTILFDKKHDFAGWQLIRLLSYTEMTTKDLSIWRAIIRLQVESAGVCVETNV